MRWKHPGQIALLMAAEFDQDEIDEIDGDCSVDIDEANEEFSISCRDLSQEGLSVGVMLLVLACGAMTIRIDTEVSDETEIKHAI